MIDEPDGVNEDAAEANVRRRFFLSRSHIYAAAFFARMSHQIEQSVATGETLDKDQFLQHRAYVVGAVLSSAAFLEAGINEIYAKNAEDFSFPNLTDEKRRTFGWLPEDVRRSFNSIWQSAQFQRSFGVLEKFDLALRLSRAEPLKGTAAYEDIPLLLLLRNELIHYKAAETVGEFSSEREMRKLERKLREKFPSNPMMAWAEPQPNFFPDGILHHACAKWAVLSSLDFMDAFCHRIGLPPRHDERTNLTTDCSFQ